MATEEKTATLTHKVRNPQDLDSWLDIWTATVSANFGENNARTNEKIVIKPSDNWQIQTDKLTGTVPVTQISNVTSGEGESSSTQKNVSIISPTGNHIAITNEDGSIKEGPVFPSSGGDATKFLNQAGNWITVETDVPFSATIPTNTTNVALAVGKGDNKHTVIIKPQGKLSFEKDNNSPNNEINLSLRPIETTDLDNNFKLPLENIEDLPENSAEVTGMVKYGNAEESPSVWLTTAEQKLNENDQPILDKNNNPTYNYTPDWGKIQTDHIANSAVTEDKIANKSVTGDKLSDTAITDKFETKLLGVFIQSNEPQKRNIESYRQLNSSLMKKYYSQSFGVQKTGQIIDDQTYYVVHSSQSYFKLAQRENDLSKIDLIQFFIQNFNCTVTNNSYNVEIQYATATLKTFNITDILPDLSYLATLYKSTFDHYFNDKATNSIIKASDYFSIRLSTQNDIMDNYINTLDSSSAYKTIASDYEFDLNDWDWKHLGIWVEI